MLEIENKIINKKKSNSSDLRSDAKAQKRYILNNSRDELPTLDGSTASY